MEEGLSFFRAEGPEFGAAEDELDGVKQVGFAGAVAADDAVHFGRKGVDFGLLFEGTEVREGYGFNVHGGNVIERSEQLRWG